MSGPAPDDLRRRIAGHFALWALALVGAGVLAASADALDASARIAIAAQPAVIATIGVAFGALLAKEAGLRSTIVDGPGVWPLFRPDERAAVITFCALGAVLGALGAAVASALADPTTSTALDAPRIEFRAALGGLAFSALVEETAFRWGATTAMIWAFLALAPRKIAIALGVIVAATLYAVAPLPGLLAVAPDLGVDALTFVVARNLVAGLLFGAAFALVRLEAAMLAHASAHIAAVVAGVALLGVDLE